MGGKDVEDRLLVLFNARQAEMALGNEAPVVFLPADDEFAPTAAD